MIRNKFLTLTLLLIVSISAMAKSDYPTEVRSLPAFHSLNLSCAVEVELQFGAEPKVVVESDILPDVKTRVADGTLIVSVDTKQNFRRAKLYITMPELRRLTISGASRLECSDLNKAATCFITASGASKVELPLRTKELQLRASGASDIRLSGSTRDAEFSVEGASRLALSGTAQNTTFRLSGASRIDAEDLTAQAADITVSGASKIEIAVEQTLSVTASGASSARYKGNPAIDRLKVSGASQVRKK